MILQDLYLHNFCLYGGLHRFDLSPKSEEGNTAPIILFGGMNGAGKTTILDAVQLALYGARARVSGRVGKPYEEYLRECVHRGAPLSEGASVSVRFRYHAEGQQHVYEVWRGWSLRDKVVRERVKVVKDDIPDDFLSEHWNDVVEDLVPLGVSQLFFFDAEKIRFLADDDTDREALGAAIKSLLGLDLAERLVSDASVVERRLVDAALARSPDDRIERLQHELETTSAELLEVKSQRASLENSLLRARKELDDAQAAFASAGGEHWERRSDLRADVQSADEGVKGVREKLREAASGDLPLLLVRQLLGAVHQRDCAEQQAARNVALFEALSERDAAILKAAKKTTLTPKAVEVFDQLLKADRDSRSSMAETRQGVNLSVQARATLQRLVGPGMESARSDAKKALHTLKSLEARRDKAARLLHAVPQDQQIAELVGRVNSAAETFGALEGKARRIDERIDALRRERDDRDRRLLDLQRSAMNEVVERNDLLRMAAMAGRTQTTMREFLRRATTQKIERLSTLVSESFSFLLRKQTLVSRVQVHPETFAIELHDSEGRVVPKSRLSEGEKQLFAIALLWGLAKASPRQLPTIIDTPMARLDSEHRAFLVDRYFPNASHQVVILSTDTEIEQGYFQKLRPRLARAYHLRYDEVRRSTVVENGYFWQQAHEALG